MNPHQEAQQIAELHHPALREHKRKDQERVPVRMNDNTILVLQKVIPVQLLSNKIRKTKIATLVLPGLGASIAAHDYFYEDLGQAIANTTATTVYLAELRGHGISEGQWSLEKHRTDIITLLSILRQQYQKVLVVAHSLSASILLELENSTSLQLNEYSSNHTTIQPQKNSLQKTSLQKTSHHTKQVLLPDGMLLLAPVFTLQPFIPKFVRLLHHFPQLTLFALTHALARVNAQHHDTHIKYRRSVLYFGHCRIPRVSLLQFWKELSGFYLGPVRIQTPSIIVYPAQELIHHENDPLLRVFGNAKVLRASWLHHVIRERATSVQQIQRIHNITALLKELMTQEKPVRFSTVTYGKISVLSR